MNCHMTLALSPCRLLPRQRINGWVLALLLVFAGCLGNSRAAAAAPVGPVRDETVYRYIIAVDQSSGMKPRMDTVRRSVLDLFAGGLSDLARPGDVIGFWTFRDKVNTRAMLPQIWVSSAREALSMQADSVLRKGRLSGKTQLNILLSELSSAAQRSGALTAIIITDGSSPFKGTPFDDRINSIFTEHAASMKSIKRPFAIALLSRNGEWVAWAASAGGGRIDIPFPADEGPLPARGAQQTLFNQGSLSSATPPAPPKTTNAPPKLTAQAPAAPVQPASPSKPKGAPETALQPKAAPEPAPATQPDPPSVAPIVPAPPTAPAPAQTSAAGEKTNVPSAPASSPPSPAPAPKPLVSPAPAEVVLASTNQAAVPPPQPPSKIGPSSSLPATTTPATTPGPEQTPAPAPKTENMPVAAVPPPAAPVPSVTPKPAEPAPPANIDSNAIPPSVPVRAHDPPPPPIASQTVPTPVSAEPAAGASGMAGTLAPAPRAGFLILGLLLFVVAALLAVVLMRARRPPPSASFISQSLDRDSH